MTGITICSDRNGNVITYTYNGSHRMTSETADDVHNKWEYNNIDKIKRTVNDNVEITYEYNTVGLVSKECVYLKNDKYAIWRSYDSAENIITKFSLSNESRFNYMIDDFRKSVL